MSDTTGGSTSATSTTSLTTFTTTTDGSTSEITSSSIIVSTTSIPPSTTFVPPSTTIISTTAVVPVTSVIVESSVPGEPPSTSIVVVTSTLPGTTPVVSIPNTSSTSTSTTSTPSALSAPSSDKSSSGLGTSGTIAIAVIIPIVAIAALFLLGLWWWRKRRARKSAEEQRKTEMAEYGYNPNNDTTLAPGAAAYTHHGAGSEDNSGYRGWGATSSNHKASTTLGSNSRAAGGMAMSDGGSQPGGYYPQTSPNTTGQASEAYSNDPLMNHPEQGNGVGAPGAGAAAGAAAGGLARHRSGNGNPGVQRGPSNASSAYSNGRAPSEASSDAPGMPANYYQEEVPYNVYNDAQPHHGPYGDGTYGGAGGQPVIRDVQARRNTRIERAPTFPQTQGGISQNF